MTTTEHQLPDPLQQRLDEATVAKAEAEASSAATQADKNAADARTAQVTALVPDLSKVKDSTLDVKDGPALFGTKLTYRALAKAAEAVAGRLVKYTAHRRVLVTTVVDLATADAGYTDVTTGLQQLKAAASALLTPSAWPEQNGNEVAIPSLAGNPLTAMFAGPIPAAATAVAGALPSVLSLLAAQRSVSTGPATTDDQAAVAAVAGALLHTEPKPTVTLDDFRLLPKDSTVYAAAAAVATLRQQLVADKLGLSDDAASKARGESIDAVVAAIDAFATTIRAVPQNGGRSPLAAAALHEYLHREGGISHVLMVKAEPGQTQQVTQNRPLWFKDRFSTLVDVNLLYVLIKTSGSKVVSAGTTTAVAKAFGKIGMDITMTVEVTQ